MWQKKNQKVYHKATWGGVICDILALQTLKKLKSLENKEVAILTFCKKSHSPIRIVRRQYICTSYIYIIFFWVLDWVLGFGLGLDWIFRRIQRHGDADDADGDR